MVMIFSASSWWSAASHAFPATDAVGSFYNLMIAQRSAASAWAVGGLGPLLLVSAAYLLAGIGAFILGERVAKRRGTLAKPVSFLVAPGTSGSLLDGERDRAATWAAAVTRRAGHCRRAEAG